MAPRKSGRSPSRQPLDAAAEHDLIRQIVCADSDNAKARLGVPLDRVHVAGAVLHACRTRKKKVPTPILQFAHSATRGPSELPPCRLHSDACIAFGMLSGHELDVMDVELLKKDVALLWTYWELLRPGEESARLARLCPYFVDAFLLYFACRGEDEAAREALRDDRAAWTYLPGMRNNKPEFPGVFARDVNDWKPEYVAYLERELSRLKEFAADSIPHVAQATLVSAIAANEKRIEGLTCREHETHELLLYMLHDLYNDRVERVRPLLSRHSWSQLLHLALSFE